MSPEQKRVTVSTDVLGIFAQPIEVQHLYEMAGFSCDLEVVAMPFQYSALVELSRNQRVGYELGGIHGQLGSLDTPEKHSKNYFDWLKVKAADWLLPKILGHNQYMPAIPIGLNSDSLPIGEMLREKTMLADLNSVIQAFDIHITFENQHNLVSGANKNKELQRLTGIRNELNQIGFGV